MIFNESETRLNLEMVDVVEDRDEVDLLAEEYVARLRGGEAVSVEEYAARCPERADEVRAILPIVAAMEAHKPKVGPLGLAVPSTIGDCRVLREIGRGGMGIVYEAEQETLGRRVAVKVSPWRTGPDDLPARRFLREARTAARLQHPNIVAIHAIGEHAGQPYFVMTLVPGLGLDRVLRGLRRGARGTVPVPSRDDPSIDALASSLLSGQFDPTGPRTGVEAARATDAPREDRDQATGPRDARYWRAVARVGLAVADALQYAHEQGVLHRDIKPANILLGNAGGVWVADFGLAKALGDDDLSRTGDLLGTLRYVAPERLNGACGPASDVYSLGLTLYEMLTLRPAFDTSDRVELLKRIADGRPPAPRSLNPAVPRDLERVVLKAIEPDPHLRHGSAAALAADLRRFLEGRPIGSLPPFWKRAWRTARRHSVVAALTASTIVLALVAAYFIRLFLLAPRDGPGTGPPPPVQVAGPDEDLPPPEDGERPERLAPFPDGRERRPLRKSDFFPPPRGGRPPIFGKMEKGQGPMPRRGDFPPVGRPGGPPLRRGPRDGPPF